MTQKGALPSSAPPCTGLAGAPHKGAPIPPLPGGATTRVPLCPHLRKNACDSAREVRRDADHLRATTGPRDPLRRTHSIGLVSVLE